MAAFISSMKDGNGVAYQPLPTEGPDSMASPEADGFEASNGDKLEEKMGKDAVPEASARTSARDFKPEDKGLPPWASAVIGLLSILVLNGVIMFGCQATFYNPHDVNKTPLTWEPYFVLDGVAIGMFLMVLGLPADLILFALSSSLCVLGIVTSEELLGGLGNSGVVAVAALCIVSKAIDQTKALKGVMASFLGTPNQTWMALLRMAFPVVTLGTVFNNTPLVAVMIPIVKDWTKAVGLQASHLMMPLSFVTMLSACITTMGSSTNLLAVQLVPEANIAFLDLAPVGLVIMVVGVAYCALLGPVLLPSTAPQHVAEGPDQVEAEAPVVRKMTMLPDGAGDGPGLESTEGMQPDDTRYSVVFTLASEGPLLGNSAAETGLCQSLSEPSCVRALGGCEGHPHLEAGDEFAAINATAEEIATLASVPGLEMKEVGAQYRTEAHVRKRKTVMVDEKPRPRRFALPVRKWVAANLEGGWSSPNHRLYEVCIPPGGLLKFGRQSVCGSVPLPMLQKRLSEWNCTLIAMRGVHPKSTDEFILQGGEMLLVEAVSKDFVEETRHVFTKAWPVIEGPIPMKIILSPLDSMRPALAVAGLACCVILSALEVTPLVPTAILVGLASIVLGTLSVRDLYGAINGPVLLTVAGSFGVGAAFEKTGVASCLAQGVLALVEDSGPYAVLASIVMLALALGVIVSNNTTVILLAPMVTDICQRQGLNLKMAMLAVIYAANLSFATPFSYQTNMMVMPHGPYSFIDYVKFGVPMMLLCGAVAILCTPVVWGLKVDA